VSINKTHEGLIKAAMQLASSDRRKPSKYPRYSYSDAGFGVHAKRCLSGLERARLELAMLNMRLAQPGSSERRAAYEAVRAMPVTIVPVKYAERLDHSKYPIERLVAIRAAGGGKKEQARAARRAAAIKGMTPVAVNDNAEGTSNQVEAA